MVSKIGGDGVALFYTTIPLIVMSWVVFITRAIVRKWKGIWGFDDTVMAIGLVLFTVTASLCLTVCFYGSGQKAALLDADTIKTGSKIFFVTELFYAASASTLKCAVAVTLLRIADSRRRYVYTIWAIIISSIVSAVIFIVVVANICHPIATLWDPTGNPNGVCNAKLNSDVSLFFSAIEIACDWTLAILPAALLWNVQMKARVKISVAAILSMATFASCATLVRLRYLSAYSDPNEYMYATGNIALWSLIEEAMGIIAGSLPALRPLLSFRHFGMGGSTGDTSGRREPSGNANSKLQTIGKINMRRPGNIALDTFQELVEGDDAHDGDADSQKRILKETQVSVTTTPNWNHGSGVPPQNHHINDWARH